MMLHSHGWHFPFCEGGGEILKEQITCCQLLHGAGIRVRAPRSIPFLSDSQAVEEQSTREQGVRSEVEKLWWGFPQSFIKQLGCERWSRRTGWVRGWLVSGALYWPPMVPASLWAFLPSLPWFHCSLALPTEGVEEMNAGALDSLPDALYVGGCLGILPQAPGQ